jgi:hypothetical protein
MTDDGLTSNFRMTDGERLVWAASYATYVSHGNRPEVAARAATVAVLGLRLVTADGIASASGTSRLAAAATCLAVADVTGCELPTGPEVG